MAPNWIDHLLVAALILGIAVVNLRRRAARARWKAANPGKPPPRGTAIGKSLCIALVSAAVLLAAWAYQGRDIALLGLSLPQQWAAWAWTLTPLLLPLAMAAALLPEVQTARTDAEVRKALFDRIEKLRWEQFMIPLRPVFVAVIGAWEELIFRGFLLWYATCFVGPWPAVVLTSVGFALGHAGQGPRIVAVTAGFGVVLGSLRVAAGGLAASALLHAAHNAFVAIFVTRVETVRDELAAAAPAVAADEGQPRPV
jgi:membrane protease YdiL (CAAX protease family)